jgi:AraC-like DNA-binding protein
MAELSEAGSAFLRLVRVVRCAVAPRTTRTLRNVATQEASLVAADCGMFFRQATPTLLAAWALKSGSAAWSASLPKQFASIVRLRAAVESYGRGSSLTTVAHDAGYFDQFHFVRTFRSFTGEPPQRFLPGCSLPAVPVFCRPYRGLVLGGARPRRTLLRCWLR